MFNLGDKVLNEEFTKNIIIFKIILFTYHVTPCRKSV